MSELVCTQTVLCHTAPGPNSHLHIFEQGQLYEYEEYTGAASGLVCRYVKDPKNDWRLVSKETLLAYFERVE